MVFKVTVRTLILKVILSREPKICETPYNSLFSHPFIHWSIHPITILKHQCGKWGFFFSVPTQLSTTRMNTWSKLDSYEYFHSAQKTASETDLWLKQGSLSFLWSFLIPKQRERESAETSSAHCVITFTTQRKAVSSNRVWDQHSKRSRGKETEMSTCDEDVERVHKMSKSCIEFCMPGARPLLTFPIIRPTTSLFLLNYSELDFYHL